MDNERQEWLEWRRGGIGSSEAAAVHGESPWSTPRKLCEEKWNPNPPEEKTSFVMEKGNEYEPRARARFAADYNLEHGTDYTFAPRRLQMEGELGFMRASLDGASDDLRVVAEFKFQGKEAHRAVKNGIIAKKYRWQLIHQMVVSGAEEIYLVSFNPEVKDEPLLYAKFTRADMLEEMANHLVACEKLWRDFVLAKKLPELTDGDYSPVKDRALVSKMKRFAALKKKADVLDAEMTTLRAEITKGVPHTHCIAGGVRVQKIISKGNVEYKKIPELAGVDLEKYRAADKTSWRLDLVKT